MNLYHLPIYLLVVSLDCIASFTPLRSNINNPTNNNNNIQKIHKSFKSLSSLNLSSSSTKMADSNFVNATEKGDIPTFDGSEKAKATDFANYFCSYAQLYHQKQMLADHNRMAAYHSAIMGNADVFKDKVVMDVGTGSGILAVWAAQAGAKRVYAGKFEIEMT